MENTTTKPLQTTPYDIIVFCHLRWDFVYQRPQHIVSRLAKYGRILFIEEPVPFSPEEENTLNRIDVNERITVMQPKVSNLAHIGQLLGDTPIKAKVGWVYSPAFIEALDLFSFDKIVYDCMDELSLFKGADSKLAQQETALLGRADVVFTGGKSLYESKSKTHPRVYCFPSSVDRPHFEKALNGIPVPADIRLGDKPIVGYYGVIDERIDMDLLAKLADKLPSVNFVMVGPLAKITEAELAKAPNIHYLGMKPYDLLPNYLKAFDIAMMPFSMNDATRYISPTKTLEFMAAYKPIVSTPVYDVVRDYAHCISIAADADAFCEAIQRLIDPRHREILIPQFDRVLETTSWDNTVEAMKQTINY